MTVRRYRDGDAAALCEIFFRSVREVGQAKYDDAQVRAWAHDVPDAAAWGTRMRENETFIAVRDGDEPVGWIELEADGHVEMLYCAPEAAGRGVAAQLYAEAEALARERGLTRLTTSASRFAESFFRKHGWSVDERETVTRFGVGIQRARMSKTLP
ncbi:MAG: GNAT family N-acetyltransferase [Candidatus Eremiobacteraeota bacterium]|nr:GNAT family N-acetyltransferase [Candidatus Eremiobacteraeota bacterium]